MTNRFYRRASWFALGALALSLSAACATSIDDSLTADPVKPPTEVPDSGSDAPAHVDADAQANADAGAEAGADADAQAEADAGAQADAGANADADADADAGADADAQPDAAPDAVVPVGLCPPPLAAGDLAVVEVMIQSASGTGDKGEWLEVQSTRDCTLDLRGLHVESPRGSGADTLTVTTETLLPPRARFLIADSGDSIFNHQLPAPLFVWDGNPSDVLKNDGDTVAFTAAGVTVESFAYPALTLHAARSISFPADCAWSDRATWERWSYSINAYDGAFEGTPNAGNTDVTCF